METADTIKVIKVNIYVSYLLSVRWKFVRDSSGTEYGYKHIYSHYSKLADRQNYKLKTVQVISGIRSVVL